MSASALPATPKGNRHLPGWIAIGAILGVFGASFWCVPATNFGGHDEWLVVGLTSRGLLSLPYVNRPLSLAFNLPGSLLTPYGLGGFLVVHCLYLSLSGALVFVLLRRLLPREPSAAFLAGVIAVVWAPLDHVRLDAVLIANYSGAAFVTLLVATLYVESWRLEGWVLAGLAAAVGAITIRSLESAAALIVAVPALLWLLPDRPSGKRRIAWAALYWSITGPALLAGVVPLLLGPPSYQMSALGLDAHPLRVAGRLAGQLGFELGPLLGMGLGEWKAPGVWLGCVVFVSAWIILGRMGEEDAPLGANRRALLVAAGGGLVAAALGFGPLVLSGATVSPARTQILSAPGIAILLASALLALVSFAPARTRRTLLGLAGTWVVAIGAGRTAAMQADWDDASYWTVQSQSLRALTEQVPDVTPNTLVVLLDDRKAFLATFTFRHALDYLYRGHAVGTVWGAQDFLYPVVFWPRGIRSEPWPVLRGPWGESVSQHAFEEIVVAHLAASGALSVLEAWPTGRLPPLPPNARYAPWERVVRGAALPPERRILSGAAPAQAPAPPAAPDS